MVDSTELTYIILGLTLLGMIWYMTNRGRANLAKAREDAAPAIAGDDVLDGAAKNPEQFDEPDDEALDEICLLYTSPSPRDVEESRMPSSA